MTDEQINYFIRCYMEALRSASGQPHLRYPKKGSKRWDQLVRAKEIVDRVGGEYTDFIHVQFQAFRGMGFAPKPEHLITKKAVDRYLLHLGRKKYHNADLYLLDGEDFMVKDTGKFYPTRQVRLPEGKDPTALHAKLFAKTDNIHELTDYELEDGIQCCAYYEAKAEFIGIKTPLNIKIAMDAARKEQVKREKDR